MLPVIYGICLPGSLSCQKALEGAGKSISTVLLSRPLPIGKSENFRCVCKFTSVSGMVAMDACGSWRTLGDSSFLGVRKYISVKKLIFVPCRRITGDTVKEEVFYGKGMKKVRESYPDLYEGVAKLNEAVFTGKALDYKTQKLIAIGIAASRCDVKATRMQMVSGMAELGITEEEIVDALRVVLLLSGMPAFTKGMSILEEALSQK